MDASDVQKKPVRVTIFNHAFTVLTSGEPADTVAIAQEIDELMSQIARRAGNLDSTRTALLACLHLADKLRSSEQELATLKGAVNRKTRDFAILLDQAFTPVVESHPDSE